MWTNERKGMSMRHDQRTGDDMRLPAGDTAAGAGRDPDDDRLMNRDPDASPADRDPDLSPMDRDPNVSPMDRDEHRGVDMSTPEREREEGLGDPTPANRDEHAGFMDEPDTSTTRSPQQMEADPEPTPRESDTLTSAEPGTLGTDHDAGRHTRTELDTPDHDAEPHAEPVVAGAPRTQSGAEEPVELWRSGDVDRFRTQWQEIQTRFVDDPRDAVQSADNLLTEVIKSLATAVNGHKTELEGKWGSGGEGETEDLRLALRRYRTFLNQLLDV
jgi:hypothetical protein